MSAAAFAAPRKTTRGFFRAHNSVIENLSLFTHAELVLALIVMRRGNDGDPVPVSDETWSAWSGLGARQKEYAIRGLKAKGLEIEGQGEKARYKFNCGSFNNYARTVTPDQAKARTAGRGVSAKPGAKVHPDCQSKGCALLNAECQTGLTLVTPTQGAQPVARDQAVNDSTDVPVPAPDSTRQTGLTLVTPTQGAQPVTRVASDVTTAAAAGGYPATMAALVHSFPLVGVAFLLRLVATVGGIFGLVSDQELSQAVALAWSQKKRVQHSEGLFLATVPEALQFLRRKARAKVVSVEEISEHDRRLKKSAAECADRVKVALEQAPGAAFEAELFELSSAVGVLESGADIAAVYAAFERVEDLILEKSAAALPDSLCQLVEDCVRAQTGASTASREIEKLRRREAMRALQIPTLTGFHT